MNEETKLSLLLRVALATAFTCVAVKWMVDQLDPTRDKKNKAKQQAQTLMSKLKIKTNIQVACNDFLYELPSIDDVKIPILYLNLFQPRSDNE